jgi:hypothetical protein
MTAEKNYSSLVLSRPMNHIAPEASGERGSRPPVKRWGLAHKRERR